MTTTPTPDSTTPAREEVLDGIQISGRTLYKLDERGVNIWSANFQPNSGYSEVEADKAAQAVAKIVFRALSASPAAGGVDAVTGSVDDAIATIWMAAMTVACNAVIMRQNDLNDDDGPVDVLNEQGAIIAALKKWLQPDSVYLEGVRELLHPADLASLSPAPTSGSEAGGEAVAEVVMFEGVGKEVSWRKGKLPPVGTKLYATPAPSPAGGVRDEDEVPFPPLDEIILGAVKALTLLDDWTNVNETEFTGWGGGDVPPGATFMRVKSGQALKALDEIVRLRARRAALSPATAAREG